MQAKRPPVAAVEAVRDGGSRFHRHSNSTVVLYVTAELTLTHDTKVEPKMLVSLTLFVTLSARGQYSNQTKVHRASINLDFMQALASAVRVSRLAYTNTDPVEPTPVKKAYSSVPAS